MNRSTSLWIAPLLVGLTLSGAGNVWASGNGVCGGRSLPPSQDRQWRNHILVCAQNVSHFLRESVWLNEGDREEWDSLNRVARALEATENRKKMQALGQKLPLIQWKGEILYDTVEHWDWTEWTFGTHPSCGYDEHTTCYTDKDGKEQCTTTYEMRACWHDEDRHESRYCSTESLPYDAHFVRPALAEWAPGVEQKKFRYFDELPNKYDLLPGESEDIQIFNTGGGIEGFFYSGNTTMAPYVAVGDAWNKYTPVVSPSSMACVFGGGSYHLDVALHTEHRIKKRSPNPFRDPVDRFGEPIEAVQWDLNNGIRVSPYQVKLSDISAVTIQSLARNSRSFGKAGEVGAAEARQSRKIQGIDSAEEVRETNSRVLSGGESGGFHKDTHLRLRLIKILPGVLQRDVRTTENLYGRGAQLSKGATGEHYKISLSDFWNASGPFSDKLWKSFSARVEPGHHYEFRVSMYQKGVPFYYQPEDFTLPGENQWFSKELPFEFDVPKNATDLRNGRQKLAEYYQKRNKMPWEFVRAWWAFIFE